MNTNRISNNSFNGLQFSEVHAKERRQALGKELKQVRQMLSQKHNQRVKRSLFGITPR